MSHAKVVPSDEKHHRLTILTEDGCEVFLVRGGPFRAYLWIGGKDGGMVTTVSGERALRELAEAILAELKAPNRRRRVES